MLTVDLNCVIVCAAAIQAASTLQPLASAIAVNDQLYVAKRSLAPCSAYVITADGQHQIADTVVRFWPTQNGLGWSPGYLLGKKSTMNDLIENDPAIGLVLSIKYQLSVGAATTDGRTINIFRPQSRRVLGKFRLHAWVNRVDFNADGRFLAVTFEHGESPSHSVGVYRLDGGNAKLLARIDGTVFSSSPWSGDKLVIKKPTNTYSPDGHCPEIDALLVRRKRSWKINDAVGACWRGKDLIALTASGKVYKVDLAPDSGATTQGVAASGRRQFLGNVRAWSDDQAYEVEDLAATSRESLVTFDGGKFQLATLH